MRAIYAYEDEGEEPEEGSLSPRAETIFMMAKDELDRNEEKYKDICEKRKAAADKRWGKKECKESSDNANNANAFFAEKENANNADNEYEYENDNDNDNDTAEAVNNAHARANAAAKEKNDEVLETYEKLIGPLTLRVSEIFEGYNLSDDLKKRAIEAAHDSNKRSLKYIEAILQGYEKDGVKSIADAERRSAEYKHRKKGGGNKGSSPPKVSSYDFDDIERLEFERRMKPKE